MGSVDIDVMRRVVDAYQQPDQTSRNNAIDRVLSDSDSAAVVKVWLENHPGNVSQSPMLKDLKNRVMTIGSPSPVGTLSGFFGRATNIATTPDLLDDLAIESRILSGRFHELNEYFNNRPEELIKNIGLIQTHFKLKTLNFKNHMGLLLDKLPTKDLITVIKENGITEESLIELSKPQMLRLSAILAKPELSNDRQRLESKLPPFAKILQEPKDLAAGIQKIRGLDGLTNEEKDEALAHYIEHHKISLNDIRLPGDEFLRLAPHLRYLDLRDFANISLAQKLLQKCSNLNILFVNNHTILEGVTALPLCEKLNCGGCTGLTVLPALPLCEDLNCWGCTGLTVLPALPLCQKLNCGDCTGLRALPALPLCRELTCWDCTGLTALPALPLCEKLTCGGCTGLRALPALPLCEDLNCWGCIGLTVLPALPLCEKLYCGGCTGLTVLPALPLCRELTCGGCTGLTALPALPLCEDLNCWGCIGLRALPALPLCQTLYCGVHRPEGLAGAACLPGAEL